MSGWQVGLGFAQLRITPINRRLNHQNRLAQVFTAGILSIAGGIVASELPGIGASAYWYSRVVYGFLAAAAFLVILVLVRRYGWPGFFTPLCMTMLGFLYFFCLIPLLNPDLLPSIYRDPRRVILLGRLIAIGMLSFIAGYVMARQPNWHWLDEWISSTKLEPIKLVRLILLLLAVATFLAAVISRGSPLTLLLRSGYSESSAIEFSVWEGANRYLWQILRYLPTALAALIMLSLVEVRLTLVQRIGLVSALGLVVLYALAPGVRYILFYVVGSIACALALVQFRTDHITNRRTFLVVGLLATGFVLTLLQYEIRTRMGLYGLLSGETGFSLRNALSNRLMELGADQNWTLDGALRALENGLIEPLWGETYIMTFVLLIPRAIWPGKPGAHWAEVSYLASPVGNNNVAYSAIGELALNFTVWAVPFGMWLAGWVAGTWWHLFRKHRKDKRIVVLYAMSLIPCAFMVRGAFAPMFGGIMYPLVLVTIVLRLSSSRTPKAKRPS